ncbi:origin recognition complex subunit 2-domain-containing protein [Pseudomassariella vexata]|uniref:Origin recognition complex subunit 2 n=1 Tax=Pseudomassariella vexata TaxID=1141098 RepID=A0A1Y2EJ23_9PEZI|nr:origin recognition complex subunit 2-domain-containing protein [Pseudomassariella vexata]ORY71314.1 origin recognition complex subunit 2-domain-containing protein [Pseudomassariella vexata]
MARPKTTKPKPASAGTRSSTRKRARDHEEPEETPKDSPPKRRIGRNNNPSSVKAAAKNTRSAYDVPSDDEELKAGSAVQDHESGEPVEEPADDPPPRRKRGRPSAASRLNGVASGPKPTYVSPDEDSVALSREEGDDSAPTATGRTKRGSRTAAVSASDKDTRTNGEVCTPRGRKTRGKDTVTPSKVTGAAKAETPQWRRNDRSARKKSARALIERVITGNASDEDDELTRKIYESSEDEDEEEADQDEAVPNAGAPESAAVTPSKRPRGRPRKDDTTRARKKSPTPPRDLPPHELYFSQNRPGPSKTSNNNLASLQLLTHEDYFSILHEYKNPHIEDVEFLQLLHAESFPQWVFELSQDFSICLYGYGSKRPLLHKFARHMYDRASDHTTNKIVIINGYVRNTAIREILGTVGSAVDPLYKPPAGNPSAMLESIKTLLSSHDVHITIILNSIDASPLRKPGMQAILAQLASHPRIQLICSADTPDFPLLWDSSLRSAFNFLFHDCTTFAPHTAEIDVVDEVHELLGRKARRVGGKEGVTYVLRSLPENAKNLFRLLVGEVLAAIDEEGFSAGENPGVEYRMLYNKAVEEFICSSEMAFRTLLKEFHDHQMITSRKDVLGTELLSVPFRKEELEGILEDLMS